MHSKDVNKLKDYIMEQADYFLREFGEFFPFGTILDKNNDIKPVSVYFGNDKPTPQEVLENLESAFKHRLKEDDINAIGICIDVIVIPPYLKEKMNALEIRVNFRNKGSMNYYVPYKLLGDGILEVYETYTSEGTLKLF